MPKIEADASCPKCSADLHTCTHCSQFDPGVAGECRAKAPYVASKAKRNDCQAFEPKAAKEFANEAGSPKDPTTPKDAKSAFDSLFNF